MVYINRVELRCEFELPMLDLQMLFISDALKRLKFTEDQITYLYSLESRIGLDYCFFS